MVATAEDALVPQYQALALEALGYKEAKGDILRKNVVSAINEYYKPIVKKQVKEVMADLVKLELNLTKACINKTTCLGWAHSHIMFSADGPKVESLIQFKGRAIKCDYRIEVKVVKLLLEGDLRFQSKPEPKLVEEPEKKIFECCVCLEEVEKCSFHCKICNAGKICKGCVRTMKGVKSCPVCRTAPFQKKSN